MANILKNLIKQFGKLGVSRIVSQEYPQTFEQELNEQCGRIIFFVSLITTFAWLPYIPLDQQLHPDEPLIPIIRMGLSAVSLSIFILHLTGRFSRCNLLFLNVIGGYLAVSCGLITALTKANPVYVGGNIFILTLLAVVPVKKNAALSVLGASLLTFFCVGKLKGIAFDTVSARYSLHDLLSAAVVAVIFIFLLHHARYNSWLKSKKIEEQSRELQSDKQKIDNLLLNILPLSVATELKERGAVQPVFYPSATIVFTDFVDFTEISERLNPEQLVSELDELFSQFDHVMDKYGLEKLKTIGDAYMFAAGVPISNKTHPIDAVLGALEIRSLVEKANREKRRAGRPVFEIRIGIHSGPLMAGVVGRKKFIYDVWGDSVNLASRMESSGEKGQVNISESTYRQIKDVFETQARGQVMAKNKGALDMYYVQRIKKPYSADERGLVPNDLFENYCRLL